MGRDGDHLRLLPFVALPAIALVSFVAATQIPFIFGPILVGIAVAGGMDLMVIVLLTSFAVPVGSCNPWTSLTGQTIGGLAAGGGFENAAGMTLAVWINAIIAFVSIILVSHFVFKGHKAKRVTIDDSEDLSMNHQQKQAFILFAGTILILLVPPSW